MPTAPSVCCLRRALPKAVRGSWSRRWSLTAATVAAAVLGGYKRVEKIMTALLLVILFCFIVVAIKGLLDWQTWIALGRGSGAEHSTERAGGGEPRRVAQRLHAGDGHRRPGAAASGDAVLRVPRDERRHRPLPTSGPAFWRTVTNLGVIWGLFSVVVIVAGATALHAVYNGAGPSYLGVSHYSQIRASPWPARCSARRCPAPSGSWRRGSSRSA